MYPETNTSLEALLVDACAQRGVDSAGARLIHHYSNAVYLLPRHDAVARVSTGANAAHRVGRIARVAQWLLDERGFAATAPLPGVRPVSTRDTTVSFWVYYAQPEDRPALTSRHLGRLLRQLHHAGDPPVALDPWVPLASLYATVSDPGCLDVLTREERQWLLDRVEQVRGDFATLDWPLGQGMIHGDAWAGNLLWDAGTGRAVLGDWDWVSRGPREIDLIPTWHAASRYGKGDAWSRAFIAEYGYDLADWPGFRLLMHMRDLVQLTGPIRRASAGGAYVHVLRQRLDGLRAGDTTSVWIAL